MEMEISTPRTHSKHDMAWQYCQKIKVEGNREHIKCLFCGKVSKGGGIHRFKEHLAGRKGGGPMCQQVPPDVKILMEQYLDGSIGKLIKRRVVPEPVNIAVEPNSDGYTTVDPFESPGPMSSTRRKKDLAWQYCQMLKEGSKVQIKCNYCAKVFKGGGIHRFKEHLAGRKGAAPVCNSVPADVRVFMQQYLGESQGKLKMKKNSVKEEDNDEEDSPFNEDDPLVEYSGGSIDQMVNIPVGQDEGMTNGNFQNKKRKKGKIFTPIAVNAEALNMLGSTAMSNSIRVAMGRFIYDIGANLDLLDSSYFQPFINMISPGSGFAAPSHREFQGAILKSLVDEVKNDIDQQRAIWEKNGCSLLVEESKHENGRILISFFVNSSYKTVYLKSVDASGIIYSVDSLYGLLKEMVEEVGAENILQIITNDEEHYSAVGKRLMSTFPSIYWAPCAAHCIDKILEDFGKLEWINTVLEQAKSVTRFIYNHSEVLNLTRKFTFGNDIVQQAQSRSATNFATLKRMADFKLNLQTMVTSQEWTDCSYAKQLGGLTVLDIVSNRSFWSSCILIIRLTSPLLQLLDTVNSKERAAIGYMFAGMYQVKETIKRELVKREDYLPYWNIIDHRWESLHQCPLHSAGFFLNPKFFYSVKGEMHNEIISRVFDSIERLVPDIEVQDKVVRELNSYKSASGDLGRKMTIRARETMLPAEWWSTYGGGCPNLARLAIRILNQTCSSTSCKQHHIPLDKVYDVKNCLERKRLSDLVFVQYNLRLRPRLEENKTQSLADHMSFDNSNNIEDWLMQNELCLENYETEDWMSLVPLSDHTNQSGATGEEPEELVTGFDDAEIFEGLKKVE